MRTLLATSALISLFGSSVFAADWPTYQHDNLRSGITSEQLNAANLSQLWVFTEKSRPQPAWYGKMERDAYIDRSFQSDSFDYDKAFNLIAANNQVFFASSSGNACVALNDSTGAELWRAPVGGAVRVAPTYDSGNVYFSSDDGQAYCVEASSGDILWRYRGGPSDTIIAGDHKPVSRFASRTGVLIQGGKAYCGFGLLTWHGNYMAKLNASTGAEENKTLSSGGSYSFEGIMLADSSKLYVTQGRNAPASYALTNVASQGVFSGSAATWATLSAAGKLFYGPGHKDTRTDHLVESTASSRSIDARHNNVNRILVNGSNRYSLIANSVNATGSAAWTQGQEKPISVILGGNTLFVGGRKQVVGYDTVSGNVLCVLPIDGTAYGLAIANGKLFATTDTGKIYCFE